MAEIREFRGYRPPRELAEKVAELPYDVCSSEEARAKAAGSDYNFYHVTKPEIDLPPATDLYDDAVYAKGAENFRAFIEKGYLVKEGKTAFYLYTLVMNGRSQTGLVCTVSVDDYLEGRVKKHEFTREDKEKDRIRHIDELGAQTGLVFLFFKSDGSKKGLWTRALAAAPEYDFTAADGIRHTFRCITDPELIHDIKSAFADTDLYIADGHHRAASAAKNALARREKPGYSQGADSDYFLSVVFPHDELKIMPYNRVLVDLNGMSQDGFMQKLGEKFAITENAPDIPAKRGTFSLYIDKKWYGLTPKAAAPDDPVASLDVSILQNEVLAPLFGIDNPRTSKRIDFIGGIRGTEELVSLVDSGKFAAAFSMHPTSLEDLIRVSDSGNVMPPKSTWFEPKLRDGLIVYTI